MIGGAVQDLGRTLPDQRRHRHGARPRPERHAQQPGHLGHATDQGGAAGWSLQDEGVRHQCLCGRCCEYRGRISRALRRPDRRGKEIDREGAADLGERQVEVVLDLPVPTPEPGEVVIQMKATGICGSDLHPYRRPTKWHLDGGFISGHEPCGVISEVGAGVDGLAGRRPRRAVLPARLWPVLRVPDQRAATSAPTAGPRTGTRAATARTPSSCASRSRT